MTTSPDDRPHRQPLSAALHHFDGLIAGWRGPALAALVALIAGLPTVLGLPPLDRDESRFAQATAQMLETRDYVNIRLQDVPRNKKPVGIHWLQAAAVGLTSNVEARAIWAYRLPSLLGAMMAAFACAWGGQALFGRRPGLVAGAILGATFLLSSEAGIAKTDAVLCAAVTVALAALARLYLTGRGEFTAGWKTKLVFWLGMAVSILVKGPIGPMVVILTLVTLGLWDRRWRWMRSLGWIWGLVIVLAVVGPWAVAITVATDGAFWGQAIGGDLAPKLAGGHERHSGFPGYYLLLSPLLLFPATLLIPAGALAAIRRRGDSGVRFAVAWLVPTWLVFELAPTKLAHYTLPTFGAIAWLMAVAITQPLTPWGRRLGAGLGVFGAVVFSGVAIYGLSAVGGGQGAEGWASPAVGLALVGAVVSAVLLLRGTSLTALIFALACGVLAHAAMIGVARNLDRLWLSQRLERSLERHRLDPRQGEVPGPVALGGYSEPSAVFALGTGTELGDGAMAARALADGRPVAVEAHQEAAFQAEAARRRLAPVPVDVIEGLNYSNGDETRLTVYRNAVPAPISAP